MSILAEILARIPRTRHAPLLIFDLDSTLFNTQPRNYAILHEFIRDVGAPEELHAAAAKLAMADLGWNVVSDLRGRGFRHEPTLTRLRTFWGARFFRDEYLRHDVPIAGAVEYVGAAHAAGAGIVYLTGRDARGMGQGTRKSLAAHGFPTESERVSLHLKPRASDDDLDFKRIALEHIRTLGEVVAAFENEPMNANLFAVELPDAQVVLLETVCSPDAPPLRPGIVRVKDFSP